jgi:hypothetical protein
MSETLLHKFSNAFSNKDFNSGGLLDKNGQEWNLNKGEEDSNQKLHAQSFNQLRQKRLRQRQ